MRYFLGFILAFLLITTTFAPAINPFSIKLSTKTSQLLNLKSYELATIPKIDFTKRDKEILKTVDKNNDKIHDYLNKLLTNNNKDFIDVIVVKSSSSIDLDKYFENLGGIIFKRFSNSIKGFSGRLPANKIYELARHKDVLLIQPNFKHKATMINAAKIIGARTRVWKNYNILGPSNLTVAVIDSGIDPTNKMLAPYSGDANFSAKIVGWHDAVNDYTVPYDDNGHGTFIAGLVAGKFYNGSIVDGKPVILVDEYGMIIDGLSSEEDVVYYWEVPFPVFKAGEYTIRVHWKDISIQAYPVTGHWSSLYMVKIYDSSGNLIKSASPTSNPLEVSFTASKEGVYIAEVYFEFYSAGNNPSKVDGPGIAEWVYVIPPVSSLDEFSLFSGMAPNAKVVGVKVLDNEGYGEDEDILDGIDWVISNKDKYHIAVATITFGSTYRDAALELAILNMIKGGIAVVIAAGNDGPDKNTISSPATLDEAIAVGCATDGWFGDINVTDWSSRGPYGLTGPGEVFETNTTKPDVVAPGGSFFEPSIIGADSNFDDNTDIYVYDLVSGTVYYYKRTEGVSDRYDSDFTVGRGTSMAAAVAGGGLILVAEALSGDNWTSWISDPMNVFRAKQLLLMTAWEIYNGSETNYAFDRGVKDIVEGFGLIQVDAAIQAIKNLLVPNTSYEAYLSDNVFEKHVWAGKIYMEANKTYILTLNVPQSSDFDLYLWDGEPDSWGQPVLLASNVKGFGEGEKVVFKAMKSGYYYITVKVLDGEGTFNLEIKEISHENIKYWKVSPPSGSLIETTKIKLRLNITVEYTYVSSVLLVSGDKNYSLILIDSSLDNKSTLWGYNLTLKPYSFSGRFYIYTPVEIMEISYNLSVYPNLTIIVAVTITGVGIAVVGFYYYRYIKRKREEMRAKMERMAEELAEETVEEIVEELDEGS